MRNTTTATTSLTLSKSFQKHRKNVPYYSGYVICCFIGLMIGRYSVSIDKNDSNSVALKQHHPQLQQTTQIQSDSTSMAVTSVARKLNFSNHYTILEDIIQPGRGYIPKAELTSTWIKETQGSYWWLNRSINESFSIAQLDHTYPTEYFDGGHPSHISDVYTQSVIDVCSLFMPRRRKVQSLVEFGNGGGYFAIEFAKRLGLDDPQKFVSVEGAGAGIVEAVGKWKLPTSQLVQHDLRLPIYLGQRYDVSVCTEVVEHVEPPFASQIITTLVLHADVVWFSFKPDYDMARAWVNHPNERPYKMWKNLFNFYGYDVVDLPEKLKDAVETRGDFIAYRTSNTNLTKVTTSDINAILPKHLQD